MLRVKKLHPDAKLPTVAHPGEDLAYDIYALEDTWLVTGTPNRLRTGIAVQAYESQKYMRFGTEDVETYINQPLGLLIRDRSSMAGKGIMVSGGVVDHGYTGEIRVLLTYTPLDKGFYNIPYRSGYEIRAGDKIAQMIPIPLLTGDVVEVDELEESARGDNGFGSTGK